ncbi:MAG: ABC transporter permease [Alphaproteobacteria bacterium]|nr:ABC transporter permease [Alphaproteobacteria bacterium]
MRRNVLVGQLLFAVAFLGLWELASRMCWVDPADLPPVTIVVATLVDLLGNPKFLDECGVTLVRVLVAFAIGAPLAVSIGFLLGEKIHLGEIFNPVIHFILGVPQSIFLPVFILVFGIEFLQKVVFGITHILFVVIVNTVAAVHAVPKPLVLAARSFGASPLQIYLRIYLPAMLPIVVTGLRLGMIFNILGVILAEMYGARTGIGLLLFRWGEEYRTPELMAGIVLISVVTIMLNEIMRIWEHRLGRWQTAMDAR